MEPGISMSGSSVRKDPRPGGAENGQYIGGIDHAIVGVRDLEQARASFERLGFHTTPLARHAGRGTGEHCLMFADGYVELCGIIDPAGDSDSLGRFLAAEEGLWSLALRTTIKGTHAAWHAAGLGPGAVADDGRTMEPDFELRCKDVMPSPRRPAACRCSPARISTPSACAARNGSAIPTAPGRSARSRWWSRSRRPSSRP